MFSPSIAQTPIIKLIISVGAYLIAFNNMHLRT